MKLGRITVGSVSPDDDRTLNQFVGSREAETGEGKLFLNLLDEKVWSEKAYFAHIHFNEEGRLVLLQINHPCFIQGRTLWVDPEKHKTVRDVEVAVAAHFDALRKKYLEPEILRLQEQDDNMFRARRQIMVDKAKAAVVAAFPEAENAEYFQLRDSTAFYSFGVPGEQTVFVVREIGGEFVGGVVRIGIFGLDWRCLRSGIETNRREGVFWTALAKEFASTKLGIPEDEFHCLGISGKERSFEEVEMNPEIDPYIVEGVRLRTASNEVVVEFDETNMPAKAYLVPAVVQT